MRGLQQTKGREGGDRAWSVQGVLEDGRVMGLLEATHFSWSKFWSRVGCPRLLRFSCGKVRRRQLPHPATPNILQLRHPAWWWLTCPPFSIVIHFWMSWDQPEKKPVDFAGATLRQRRDDKKVAPVARPLHSNELRITSTASAEVPFRWPGGDHDLINLCFPKKGLACSFRSRKEICVGSRKGSRDC